MASLRPIFQIGAALTGATLVFAAGLDLASEQRAQDKISAANTPVEKRIQQCQKENQSCNTTHAALFKCLDEKKDRQTSAINAILNARSDDKIAYRGAMGFCALYFFFMLSMARRQQPEEARLPRSP